MAHESDIIPNTPGQVVFVQIGQSVKVFFGPNRGKRFAIVHHYAGVSAARPSGDESKPAVVWKFVRGGFVGGDSPESERLWNEIEISVPGDLSNAREFLEENLPGEAFVWSLLDAEPKPEVLPG